MELIYEFKINKQRVTVVGDTAAKVIAKRHPNATVVIYEQKKEIDRGKAKDIFNI